MEISWPLAPLRCRATCAPRQTAALAPLPGKPRRGLRWRSYRLGHDLPKDHPRSPSARRTDAPRENPRRRARGRAGSRASHKGILLSRPEIPGEARNWLAYATASSISPARRRSLSGIRARLNVISLSKAIVPRFYYVRAGEFKNRSDVASSATVRTQNRSERTVSKAAENHGCEASPEAYKSSGIETVVCDLCYAQGCNRIKF